jgi:hypothetical protein
MLIIMNLSGQPLQIELPSSTSPRYAFHSVNGEKCILILKIVNDNTSLGVSREIIWTYKIEASS